MQFIDRKTQFATIEHNGYIMFIANKVLHGYPFSICIETGEVIHISSNVINTNKKDSELCTIVASYNLKNGKNINGTLKFKMKPLEDHFFVPLIFFSTIKRNGIKYQWAEFNPIDGLITGRWDKNTIKTKINQKK